MTVSGSTVLVTGATGFLGGYVARRFAKDGATVHALARRPERDMYIRDIPNVEIVEGDITDRKRMTELCQGVDYVVHAAAAMSGSLRDQSTVNIHGTYNIARAASEAGVKRLVHVSTISVYGYGNRQDVTEETPFDPGADPYHVTKVGGEKTVVDVHYQHGIEYSIIRPGMIYGPRSQTWTKQMFRLAKGRVMWLGDGRGSAYPIHVEDVAEMCCILAAHPNAANEAFNCTPDPSPTWRTFLLEYARLDQHQRWLSLPPMPVKMLAPIIARLAPANHQAKDLNDLVPFLLNHITYKMDKSRNLLDWEPQISLKEGIASCEPYLHEKGLID